MADAADIEDAVHKALEAIHDKFPDNSEEVERAIKSAYSHKPLLPKRKRGVKGTAGRPPIDRVALAVWVKICVSLFLESVRPRKQSLRWGCQETAKLGLRYVMAANNNPEPVNIRTWQTVMRYWYQAQELQDDERSDGYGSAILGALSHWLELQPPYLDRELAKQWQIIHEELRKDSELKPFESAPLIALPGGMNLLTGQVSQAVYERLQRGMDNLNKSIMKALSTT